METNLPVLLLVDDHPLFRLGLRLLLSSSPQIRADILEAGTLAQALAVAATVDLVLLDISLPGGDGLSGLAALRARWPGAAVVMLSAHDHAELMHDAARLGASGFLSKSLEPEALCQQVRRWLARDQGQAQVPDMDPWSSDTERDRGQHLSARQYEVLKLVALGLSNKAIARRLDLSEYTVRNHVVALLRHFDAQTRTQAVSTAQSLGVLPPLHA